MVKDRLRGRRKKRRRRPKESYTKRPKVGDFVEIIVKPYFKQNLVRGFVRRVLTKKKYHSRGHKVLLMCGVIGRTVRVIKEAANMYYF